MILYDKPDNELIQLFVRDNDNKAMNVLVRRHYQRLFKRFRKHLKDENKANDLCQDLWLKVIRSLPNYKDQSKFEYYLNTVATNLLKDHWQTDKSSMEQPLYNSQDDDVSDHLVRQNGQSYSPSEEENSAKSRAINYLTHTLIPKLPVDQRLVYLLRHESEHWDANSPLQWQHLADLNGMETEEVIEMFITARDKLTRNSINPENPEPVSSLEYLIFLIWTQSQRVNKNRKLTETYFAALLGMPVNTFKTKYRAAVKTLAEGLKKWM